MNGSINKSTTAVALTTLSILLVIATIISFMNVVSINANIDKLNVDRFDLAFNANKFMNGSALLTNEVRAYAATGNRIHYDGYMHELDVAKNRDIGVARMQEIGITSDEQAKIDAMSALSNNLVPLEVEAMELAAEHRRDEALEAVYGDYYHTTITQIRALKDEFLEMLDQRAHKTVDDMIAVSERAERLTFVFISIVVLLQILNALFALFQTSQLKKYIGDISQKLRQMSEGNMSFLIDLDYVGEFAPIKASLQKTLDALNDTISHICSASQQVSGASRQLSDDAQSLANGSADQTTAIESLSASISDVREKTNRSSDVAKEATGLSNRIMTNAVKGSERMDDMMKAVMDINDASHQVGDVIKAIDDVAFQTNILALNAAVEAARAGQHGRGFAVVAEEVRNLAVKSSEAAKSSGELIRNTMEKATLGMNIAKETAASLKEIVDSVEHNNKMVEQIALASDEQSVTIGNIYAGIDQVAHVIQRNSETSQRSAATAEQMSSQSFELERLVGGFSIRGCSPLEMDASIPYAN